VITGIEKQDGDIGVELDGELREQNILGLKTAGQAHITLLDAGLAEGGANIVQLGGYLFQNFDCAH
jgi:hypothetical protein